MTNLARSLFEEYKDYGSAIELAVDEAIRTRSLTWYDILNGYADQGLTTPLEPAYYTEALISLYEIDKATFERLAASFWESYKELPFHFSWLIEFDRIVKTLKIEREYQWHLLSAYFQESYFGLINGQFLIEEIAGLVSNLLENWLAVTDSKHELVAATAVCSWNEMFPSSIRPEVLEEAEQLSKRAVTQEDGLEQALKLFESMQKWAEAKELSVSSRLKWQSNSCLILRTIIYSLPGHLAAEKEPCLIPFLKTS